MIGRTRKHGVCGNPAGCEIGGVERNPALRRDRADAHVHPIENGAAGRRPRDMEGASRRLAVDFAVETDVGVERASEICGVGLHIETRNVAPEQGGIADRDLRRRIGQRERARHMRRDLAASRRALVALRQLGNRHQNGEVGEFRRRCAVDAGARVRSSYMEIGKPESPIRVESRAPG
jgi:hypothetical protein